jgi:hypothetical protein
VSLGQLVLRARQVALLARLQVRLEWQEQERQGQVPREPQERASPGRLRGWVLREPQERAPLGRRRERVPREPQERASLGRRRERVLREPQERVPE